VTGAVARCRALVLGGSSGVGAEVARRAAQAGAQLVLTGRNEVKLAAIAEATGAMRTVAFDAHDEKRCAPSSSTSARSTTSPFVVSPR
jgi:NADP-dependent 3-hydroxy acid dehydrogenase YdfG